MSDDESRATLLTVARAIALGEPIEWNKHVGGCSPTDSDVLVALRALERIATAHRHILDASVDDFASWAHLSIVARGPHVGQMVRCRARDSLGKEVGLLLIGPLNGNAVHVQALLTLARLMTRVHHPNLATVHGADYAHDHVGLWYEEEPGNTLDELTRSDTPALVESTLIVRDIARALHALHTAGLVHGNVAPSTIKRTLNGRVLLLPSLTVEKEAVGDISALGEVLRSILPRPDRGPTHTLAGVSTAAAFEAAIERAVRPSWWTNEWFIGFLSAAALAGIIGWLVAK